MLTENRPLVASDVIPMVLIMSNSKLGLRMTTFIHARLAVATLIVVALALFASSPTNAIDSGERRLEISSPAANTVAIAGKAISVVIKGSAANFPKGAVVLGEGGIGPSSIAALSGGVATIDVSIPASIAPGTYHLTALATDAHGVLTSSEAVPISVEREGLVSRLDVNPMEFFADRLGDSRRLTIIAKSRDGTSHDVTESQLLRVTSANTSIVSVQGTVVTATGHGKTTLSVSYQNWSVEIPATVP